MFSRIPNLQFFKNVSVTTYLFSQQRHFAATLKENKNFFREKKSWI